MSVPPILILNPGAGTQRKSRQLPKMIRQLRLAYPNLEIVSTNQAADGMILAQKAVQKGCRLILCAGGDGTINEVVNGLAGTGASLAVLPTGTGNALAHEIGLPANPVKAVKCLASARPKGIPLGKVNNRYFLLLAGVGFDAFVISRVSPRLKRRSGIFAYLVAGFFSLFQYPYPTIRFKLEDQVIIGTSAFLAKARCSLGPFALAPQAGLEEPWLDLFILKGRGPVAYFRYTLAVLLGRLSTLPDVEYRKIKEVVVSSDSAIWVHADGEPIEQADSYRIQATSDQVHLLVPPGP